jgi:hypothetical protein
MIDLLEEKGIIGPAQGSKARVVYITKDDEVVGQWTRFFSARLRFVFIANMKLVKL